MSRLDEALRHIALSDLPPPPYAEPSTFEPGASVTLRVQFEDTSRPVGVVQKAELVQRAGFYTMMVTVDFDGSIAMVRAEWLL